MKNIALFTLFAAALLLISGCATRKASLSVDSHAAEQTQTAVLQQQGSRTQRVSAEQASANLSEAIRDVFASESAENLRLNLTLYDTARPADSTTGKPPLLAEATLHRERQTSTHHEHSAQRAAQASAVTTEITHQADSSHTELTASADRQEAIKLDEKTKTVQRVPWWVWVIGLGITVMGWRFLRKKLSR